MNTKCRITPVYGTGTSLVCALQSQGVWLVLSVRYLCTVTIPDGLHLGLLLCI